MYTIDMLGNFFKKGEQTEKPIQEVSVADAILMTHDIPRVGRAVQAYVAFQNQIKLGGQNSQDTPELNKRITAVYDALASSGVQLLPESTSYGVDDTLRLFVDAYIATQEEN